MVNPQSELQVVVEGPQGELLGREARRLLDKETIQRCARALVTSALDPTKVRLVFAVDFVASVTRRMESDGPIFDLRRNDGMVGGKTMGIDNGGIDVLIPAALVALAPRSTRDARLGLVIRTVSHESFHVAMMQAGEGEQAYPGLPRAQRDYLLMADQVIGEYRAEAAVPADLRKPESRWDPIAVLTTMQSDLARIAAVEYQEHLDIDRLCNSVLGEAHTAWKLLAVHIAHGGDGVLEDSQADPERVWERLAAPQWEKFAEIIRSIPNGGARVPEEVLRQATEDIADEFRRWLRTLGFDYRDDPEGGAIFTIADWGQILGGERAG
jgi:hypothetical protein